MLDVRHETLILQSPYILHYGNVSRPSSYVHPLPSSPPPKKSPRSSPESTLCESRPRVTHGPRWGSPTTNHQDSSSRPSPWPSPPRKWCPTGTAWNTTPANPSQSCIIARTHTAFRASQTWCTRGITTAQRLTPRITDSRHISARQPQAGAHQVKAWPWWAGHHRRRR